MYTLITGASSGIGAEIAVRLSAERAIVLCGRDKARLESVRMRCQHPERHRLMPCDLSHPDALDQAIDLALKATADAVDTFVHAAGTDTYLSAKNFDLSAAQEMMQVNLFSAMQITRVLLRKANHAALRNVLLVSSVAAVRGTKGKGIYTATKGALDAWTRALAAELAPLVRVNAILPGAVITPLTEALLNDAASKSAMEQAHPLGLGTPSDIAAAAAFLISDNARWITGQSLCVDGGYTL